MLNEDGDSPLGLGKDLAPSSVSNPHMKGLRQSSLERDILLGPPECPHRHIQHTYACTIIHTHTRKKVMLGLIVSLKPATVDCLKKKMGVESKNTVDRQTLWSPLEIRFEPGL